MPSMNSVLYSKFLSLLCALLLGTSLLSGCASGSNSAQTRTAVYFDTVISITLYGPDTEELFEKCFSLADRCESLFDANDPESDIARINAHPFEAVDVDPQTLELLTRALYWCEESDGLFDITIGRLTALWNIPSQALAKETAVLPDAEEIEEAAAGVDYTCVVIKGNTVTLNSDKCAIDVGGIAKGYIGDQMKKMLQEQKVSHALINLGGNIVCIGGHPDGRPFTIGIQKPFAADGTAAASVSLTEGSAVTSGTYQRYIEADGKRYHHLLDPATGWPKDTGLDSVTIFCESSTDADALSTIVFLLGETEGLTFLQEHRNSDPDANALLIRTDGSIEKSPAA